MKLYFDRTLPMSLSLVPTFDGHLVDVDEAGANTILKFEDLIGSINMAIDVAGAPEDSAQALATAYIDHVNDILKEHNDA